MSYEGQMLVELKMPDRTQVEEALLKTLFRHNGVVKEFASGQEIVDGLADEFRLDSRQRAAALTRIYRKENRTVESLLWHRLLFRAADSLAKRRLVSRPSSTVQLTGTREWMLTEKGYDQVLGLLHLPQTRKELLRVKSFEVEKVVRKLSGTTKPVFYNPFDSTKRVVSVTTEKVIRSRAFRLAVIEAYGFSCAFCGLKLRSPDSLLWEVEAAHIVPNSFKGRDDIWNGLALCRVHHWMFDVGWLTVKANLRVEVSPRASGLPKDFAKAHGVDIVEALMNRRRSINLPANRNLHPHEESLAWHRQNLFVR